MASNYVLYVGSTVIPCESRADVLETVRDIASEYFEEGYSVKSSVKHAVATVRAHGGSRTAALLYTPNDCIRVLVARDE